MQFSISKDALLAPLQMVAQVIEQEESRRKLARMADYLKTLGDMPLTQGQLVISPAPDSGNAVSCFGLASYFERAINTGQPPAVIAGKLSAIPASSVSIKQAWLDKLGNLLSKQEVAVTGFLSPANDTATLAAVVNAPPVRAMLPPADTSTPAYQGLVLKQQRASENANAAARLRMVEDERDNAREEAEFWKARALAAESARQLDQEEKQQMQHQLNTERRLRTKAEDQLRDAAGLLAFMDENNPYSPPEGRLALTIWCAMTCDGTIDPMEVWPAGMKEQVSRMLKQLHKKVSSGAMLDRICTLLTWPSRKNGGVISASKRTYGKGKG